MVSWCSSLQGHSSINSHRICFSRNEQDAWCVGFRSVQSCYLPRWKIYHNIPSIFIKHVLTFMLFLFHVAICIIHTYSYIHQFYRHNKNIRSCTILQNICMQFNIRFNGRVDFWFACFVSSDAKIWAWGENHIICYIECLLCVWYTCIINIA